MVAYTPAIYAAVVLPGDGDYHNCSGYNLARDLAANTAETFNVPTGAKKVSFTCTDNYWVAFTFEGYDDRTAAIPGADVTDGSAAELNPIRRTLSGGPNVTKISVITANAAKISLQFFS